MSQEGSNSRWSEEEIENLRQDFPVTPAYEMAEYMSRSKQAIKHKARRLGITKADNYHSLKSVNEREIQEFKNDDFAHFVSGFVAGEGSFSKRERSNRDGIRFCFQIEVADVDEKILHKIKEFFGVGNIHTYESRKEEWKDIAQYQVQSVGDIFNSIIPFFEKYGLFGTHKSKQYESWRDDFLEYHRLTKRFKYLQQ